MNNHINEKHLIQVMQKLPQNEDKTKKLGETVSRLEQRIVHLEIANLQKDGEIESLKESLRSVGLCDKNDINAASAEPLDTHSGALDQENHHLRQQLAAQQRQIDKLNESNQSLQQSLAQHDAAINELRLRQDILDVKASSGVFIWKIPDVRRRYRDAVDHRTVSLYSPPFYTSPHGYRMCIRTYLNGDGIGKGTHVSVFFVVMRSEHDNLLSWPFKQSVRLTLLNQNDAGNSITMAFIPDRTSCSFQRPVDEMNSASGFPKFASQSVLQNRQFTEGNVIYIKCQVDLTGLMMT